MTNSDTETLERLIDAHGLADVLATAGTIAHEKSAHILASYGEESRGLARSWNHAAATCTRAAQSRPVEMVSP